MEWTTGVAAAILALLTGSQIRVILGMGAD
jgi:hypothetical protein